MKTYTVQIGNSDDKLTQKMWSQFIDEVDDLILQWSYRIHFAGFSNPEAQWQNACWVFQIADPTKVKIGLSELGRKYNQDMVAWTVGNTEMI